MIFIFMNNTNWKPHLPLPNWRVTFICDILNYYHLFGRIIWANMKIMNIMQGCYPIPIMFSWRWLNYWSISLSMPYIQLRLKTNGNYQWIHVCFKTEIWPSWFCHTFIFKNAVSFTIINDDINDCLFSVNYWLLSITSILNGCKNKFLSNKAWNWLQVS